VESAAPLTFAVHFHRFYVNLVNAEITIIIKKKPSTTRSTEDSAHFSFPLDNVDITKIGGEADGSKLSY
jgi:hypothetical protein